MADGAPKVGKPSTRLIVQRTELLTRRLRRVWFGGPDFNRYQPNRFTDCYVKLVFPRSGVVYPEPFDLPTIRRDLPSAQWPVQRTYTVRKHDPGAQQLAIDFVHHGDDGIAGPWSARAQPGDELLMLGPGGAYSPNPDADWHLFVADESALPAVAAALEVLRAECGRGR
jgi:NADPH-dependent ferric siderophore reductase